MHLLPKYTPPEPHKAILNLQPTRNVEGSRNLVSTRFISKYIAPNTYKFSIIDRSETQSSDGNEDEDEEQDAPLVNPSTDIKGDLKRLLEKETFKLNGSFYYSKSYTHAPNPALKLDGLGIVGLPLSKDVARNVISKSKPAPFGKGERTIVDRNVRDTWEMDASKVRHYHTRNARGWS
jgi:hypothetical protein